MKARSRYRRAAWRITFFSFAAAALLGVALLATYFPAPDASTVDVTVPALVGTPYAKEDDRLPEDLYRVTVIYQTDDTTPAGTILAQTPAPNTTRRAVRGKRPCSLQLTLSAGTPNLTLPELIGLDADAAALRLREMGLSVVQSRRQTTALSPGQVMDTTPAAGSLLHRGDTVTLTVSTTATQKTRTVPDVVGLPREVAAASLRRMGLPVKDMTYAPSELPAGTVLAQFPLGGTIVSAALSSARLTLSDGSLLPPTAADEDNTAEIDEQQKEAESPLP